MKKHILIIAVLVLCSFCISCKKESSPVNIFAFPFNTGDTIPSGTVVAFHVKAISDKNTVQKISVTSLDTEHGFIYVWDTLINSKKAEFDFFYKAPVYMQEEITKVALTFTASANTGDDIKMSYNLYVSKGGSLVPYNGIIMYSALSNGRNGFNIANVQTIYTSTIDESSVDIYDYFDSGIGDSTLLCREWRSKTNLLFVKFNDFDFASATQASLHHAYNAGAKFTSIPNLQIGDVILVGRNNTELGAIQITAIFDEEGIANDRYIFNFKKPL